MHDDEIPIDEPLVRALIRTQFPMMAHLPLRRVASTGTSNALYRLGETMVVRLPLTTAAEPQIYKDHRWLPVFASYLPVAVPTPLAVGQPSADYPCRWAVHSWLKGDDATLDHISDSQRFARDLAQFINALQRVDTAGAPLPDRHNFGRGVHLQARDAATRRAIDACDGLIDTDAALRVWDAAVHAPVWDRAPVWIHGDLLPTNMLAHNGRLSAVIDWGGAAAGDPACDLQPAWNVLPAADRQTFRTALAVDDATWLRGRGWSLSVAVIALPYYRESNPAFADLSRRTIEQVLADSA